jgi:Suppressor of fused protein (SUFU)
MEALYCGAPVYFSDEFHEIEDTDPPTILVWLIPITRAEAVFIAESAWERFEDALVESDPDLLDLERPSVI